MLRKSHVRPFLSEHQDEVEVEFLEDPGDGRVASFLDRLCRLARKLEGRPRREVREAFRRQERRIRDRKRLAGVTKSLLDRCEFRPPEGADRAPEIRNTLFEARGELWPPVPGDARKPYERAAAELGISPEEIERLLYADDPAARVLAAAPEFRGEALLRAYDLDLARGVLLDAARVTVTARGAWGDVFRAIKLARLMYRIERAGPEGGAEAGAGRDGYRVHLTGPAAPFVLRSERYGYRFARVVPALARAPGWALEAEIVRDGRRLRYRLDGSVLPFELEGSPTDRARYDSSWERSLAEEFAERIGPEREGWTLEREATPVALGPAPGRTAPAELFLPDFTLRHEDGREALVEIVGFWTPEYLEEKIRKVRAAGLDRLVLVVYRDLGAGPAGEEARRRLEEAAPGPVVWFARKPRIGPVMEAVERAAG